MTDPEGTYIIWSTKLGGWFTAAGNYSSQVAEAKRFLRQDAINACAVHYANGSYGWIPVYLADLAHVRENKK